VIQQREIVEEFFKGQGFAVGISDRKLRAGNQTRAESKQEETESEKESLEWRMRRYKSIVRRRERARAPIGRHRGNGCCAIWKRAGHEDVAAGALSAQRPKQYSTSGWFCAKAKAGLLAPLSYLCT